MGWSEKMGKGTARGSRVGAKTVSKSWNTGNEGFVGEELPSYGAHLSPEEAERQVRNVFVLVA